jgi:flagellar biosynthesis anti-sigma factor FlgM
MEAAMSYTNGIGNSTQLSTLMATAATAQTSPTNVATRSGDSVPDTNGLSDDQTTFSTAANLITQPSGDTGVRLDRVSALQEAISAGIYNVSASDVADKLIQTMTR